MPGKSTILLITTLCLSHVTGCQPPIRHTAALIDEIAELKQERRLLTAKIEEQDKKIETLNEALNNFSQLGDKRINELYFVKRIEIDRLSGGSDFDNQPGDDGVTIYLKLYDQDDHEFKASGEIRVHLYDLQNDRPELIGEYKYNVDEAKKLWYGRLWTYHYKIRCPWPEHPPRSRRVMARVTFLDYLTGNALHDSREFEITPPPNNYSAAPETATQP